MEPSRIIRNISPQKIESEHHPRWCGTQGCEKCELAHPKANPHCQVCNGSGWLYEISRDGKINPRHVIPCDAPACHAESLNLPLVDLFGVFRCQTFDNFVENEGNKSALQSARELASENSGFTCLAIHGVTGNGKSHLANAVAQKLQVRGEVVSRVTMLDWVDELQDAISTNTVSSKIKQYKIVPVLIFDELKIEHLMNSKSDWLLDHFEQILDYRLNVNLLTMLTTNNTPEQLPPRIRSRLQDKTKARMIWNKDIDRRRTSIISHEID